MALLSSGSSQQHQKFSQFQAAVIPLIRLFAGNFFAALSDVSKDDLARSCEAVLFAASEYRSLGHGEGDGLSEYARSRYAPIHGAEIKLVVSTVVDDISDGVDDSRDVVQRKIEAARNAWVAKELERGDKADQCLLSNLRLIPIPEAVAGAISLRNVVRLILDEVASNNGSDDDGSDDVEETDQPIVESDGGGVVVGGVDGE